MKPPSPPPPNSHQTIVSGFSLLTRSLAYPQGFHFQIKLCHSSFSRQYTFMLVTYNHQVHERGSTGRGDVAYKDESTVIEVIGFTV